MSKTAVVTGGAGFLGRHVVARFDHWPLARYFFSRTREREFSERLARAIVKEAGYLRVEPSLLAGVLLTENAPLDAPATSTSSTAPRCARGRPASPGSWPSGTLFRPPPATSRAGRARVVGWIPLGPADTQIGDAMSE